jgi:molecular chaperone GrpE
MMGFSEEDSQRPVIRDRRRIDPVTGQVRDTERAADQAQAGPPQRGGPAQARPGRHAVSKPGGGAGGAGGYPPGEPSASGGQGNGPQGDEPGAGASGPPSAAPAGSGEAADAELAARLAERTADLQRLQAEYANYRKRVERDRLAVREQALANVLTELLPILDDIGRAREHGELSGGFKSVAESLESAVVKLGLTSYGEDGEPFDPKLHEALMHSYSPDVDETTCVRILQPGYKVGDRILRPARVAVAEPGEPEPHEPADLSDEGNEGGGDDAQDSEHAGSEAASGRGDINTPGSGGPRAGGSD